ncbi:sugar phosphate isomerase/epimerase [soil metagenome]
MKIGFNLLVVGTHIGDEHAPLLERIKAIGYDGVEIPVFEGEPAHYAKLGNRLKSLGLESTIVTIVTEETSPISLEKSVRAKARDRLHWTVDVAHALGATDIAGPYHSPLGVFTGGGPSESEIDHGSDVLREAAAYGEKARVHFSIEALNRFECYFLNTMAQASELRRRVNHPNFSYMYDTFHANIEERDLVRAYADYAHEITHIHLSENDRGIVGRGHVPFGPVIAAIKAGGYDGWLTVEAFGRALPALAAATRVWRDLFPDIDTLLTESLAEIRKHLAA